MAVQRHRILSREAHLWTLFKSWRFSVVRKKDKRDHHRMSEKERDFKFIYEESLLLHDLLITTDDSIADHRMDFVQYIYNAIQEHDAAIVTRLDRQGFSPLTYATLYGRRDESILQIAVPLMRQVQAKATRMMEDRNYEGSKRVRQPIGSYPLVPPSQQRIVQVFVKASRDFLSGSFLLCGVILVRGSQGITLLMSAGLVCGGRLHRLMEASSPSYNRFQFLGMRMFSLISRLDPPEIVVDLPAKWRVTLGTRVVYTIEVKGEPLTYQWFCDGRPLEGFTTDTLDVTGSAVAEDAGAYFCRLTNWRGSVDSTTSVLIVLGTPTIARSIYSPWDKYFDVDDTVVVDPSTRYYRTLPLHPQDVLFNVNAAVGGVLDVHHVQLFIPPRSFEVWDLFDANLADTRGMDVVIRTELEPVLPPIPSLGDGNQVGGWQVVSPLVVVTPHPLDPFQIPWTLRLPHHAAQIQTTNSDNQEFSSHVTVLQCIKDVDSVQTLHVIPPRQLRYTDLNL
ncbi:hypothetical protein DYB32_004994 [Aphanomyces invadans]|uniref:Ig-like domain-containing protein n=1 Tax=Aphanomyces invadans TaxID=157072 RepID=A0A418AVX6_9STRA|nr:hypothetical protein DYB32_004994 [Aphanomyces invadans]